MKGVVDGGGGDRLWKSIDVKNLLCKRAKRKIHPNEKILKIKMIEMNDTDKDNETNRNERVKKKQNQQHLETNKSCYCLIFFTRLIFRTIFFLPSTSSSCFYIVSSCSLPFRVLLRKKERSARLSKFIWPGINENDGKRWYYERFIKWQMNGVKRMGKMPRNWVGIKKQYFLILWVRWFQQLTPLYEMWIIRERSRTKSIFPIP